MDAIRHYHDLRELSGREQELRIAAERHRRFEELRAADPTTPLRRRIPVGRRVIATLSRVARALPQVRRPSA